MGEMRIHFTRGHRAALTHISMHGVCLLPAVLRPLLARRAWVHQRVHAGREEAIGDEEIFFEAKGRIASLQVACVIVPHPMAQRQVLCQGNRI